MLHVGNTRTIKHLNDHPMCVNVQFKCLNQHATPNKSLKFSKCLKDCLGIPKSPEGSSQPAPEGREDHVLFYFLTTKLKWLTF